MGYSNGLPMRDYDTDIRNENSRWHFIGLPCFKLSGTPLVEGYAELKRNVIFRNDLIYFTSNNGKLTKYVIKSEIDVN